MINNNQWMQFLTTADTYNGRLTIGQLFCQLFEVSDPEIANADDDTVWQLIVNKYRSKG